MYTMTLGYLGLFGPAARSGTTDGIMGGANDTTAREPIRFFSEEELDAMEEVDPDRAYRIARAQAMAERGLGAERRPEDHPPPDPERVREAIADVRQILNQDGGDIELVAVEGRVIRVRLKGACVGCPNAPLDLKNVVEKILFNAVPGAAKVANTF